ncbi:hypothetical protein ACFPM0_21825 [Pseudonocardia sulfidoxydans]|uniref:hypothetical protein n=1 Tax=Pseudonocardia sulfidoxydans TaxID=54011 RepID=UPI00360CDBD0
MAVSGRYRRYEQGLRFEHQRVRKVWTGRCECGRAAEVFTDSGDGVMGWRQLSPCCASCAAGKPVLPLPTFAQLTGQDGVVAAVDRQPLRHFCSQSGLFFTDDRVVAEGNLPGRDPLLDAELAVVNARLDELQRQLSRLLDCE